MSTFNYLHSEVSNCEKLSNYALRAYIEIMKMMDWNTCEAFPSYETIAKKGKMSRVTAIKSVKELIALGFIKKETRKSKFQDYNLPNVYTLLLFLRDKQEKEKSNKQDNKTKKENISVKENIEDTSENKIKETPKQIVQEVTEKINEIPKAIIEKVEEIKDISKITKRDMDNHPNVKMFKEMVGTQIHLNNKNKLDLMELDYDTVTEALDKALLNGAGSYKYFRMTYETVKIEQEERNEYIRLAKIQREKELEEERLLKEYDEEQRRIQEIKSFEEFSNLENEDELIEKRNEELLERERNFEQRENVQAFEEYEEPQKFEPTFDNYQEDEEETPFTTFEEQEEPPQTFKSTYESYEETKYFKEKTPKEIEQMTEFERSDYEFNIFMKKLDENLIREGNKELSEKEFFERFGFPKVEFKPIHDEDLPF